MVTRITSTFVATALLGVTLVSCTGTNNPQLAMCQALTKELIGRGVSKWIDISERETERMRTVSIKFTDDRSSAGKISCDYPREEGGNTETAPVTVTLNGERVEKKTLFVSGQRVTTAMLTEAAELTSLKAEALARDAAGSAEDLAGQALNSAKDAAKSLQQ